VPRSLAAAHAFLWTHARLLERRIFEQRFLGGPAEAVERAVDAYRNEDGGFGAALEPDCRTPHSQPEATRWALAVLEAAGRLSAERARRSADWLASIATPEGGVPFCLPTVEGYPKAPWWQAGDPPAGNLNPTARLVALLRRHAPEHPFVRRAAAWCWERISGAVPESQYQAHAILELLLSEPDRTRAAPLLEALGSALAAGRIVPIDPKAPPPSPDTHTPLHFAPSPEHPLHRHLGKQIIEGFLDRLAAEQQDDGGWPIDWPAPGATAVNEWRAIKTLEALETLSAYGRL
jgi:hypothetical protein